MRWLVFITNVANKISISLTKWPSVCILDYFLCCRKLIWQSHAYFCNSCHGAINAKPYRLSTYNFPLLSCIVRYDVAFQWLPFLSYDADSICTRSKVKQPDAWYRYIIRLLYRSFRRHFIADFEAEDTNT